MTTINFSGIQQNLIKEAPKAADSLAAKLSAARENLSGAASTDSFTPSQRALKHQLDSMGEEELKARNAWPLWINQTQIPTAFKVQQ